MKITYKLAHVAGWDAGNRNAAKNGWTVWNEDDFAIAAQTLNKLLEGTSL